MAHWTWLDKLRLPNGIDQEILAEYLSHVDVLQSKLQGLDRRIEELAATAPYREQVKVLCGFRGVSTLAAMVLTTELGDIRRFPSPRALMLREDLTQFLSFFTAFGQLLGGCRRSARPWSA